MKYHFRINNGISNKKNDAGNKAVADCKAILLANGYNDLELYFYKPSYLLPVNLIKLAWSLFLYFARIPKASLIFVQYPLLGINRYFRFYAGWLKRFKSCKFACIIHDLDSARSQHPQHDIPREIQALSVYDAVISHNPAMTSWLTEHGYRGSVCEIGLFDYLSAAPPPPRHALPDKGPRRIVFAGNLARVGFISHLRNIANLHINLYGPGFNKDNERGAPSVNWMGSFSTEEIMRRIEGNFGLVWDGTSTEQCTGIMGNYLRYNTSHKLSLYLLAGLPVIVPECAAVATFVKKRKIGLTVASIDKACDAVEQVTAGEYHLMQENIAAIREELCRGTYFLAAIKDTETALYHEKAR